MGEVDFGEKKNLREMGYLEGELLGQRSRRRTCKNLCGNPFPIGTIEPFSRAKPQAKLLIRMTDR